MSDSFKTENKFEDATVNTSFDGSHIIATDDEKFHDLALSSFDAESLRAWINQSNARELIKVDSRFINTQPVTDDDGNQLIDEETGEPLTEPSGTPEGIMGVYRTILGVNRLQEDDPHNGYLNIDVWRTTGRNGEYVKIEKFSDWNFQDIYGEVENSPGSVYSYDRLDLEEFKNETFIENIIELNQEILLKYIEEPVRSNWSVKERLRDEFITDVMTSRNGYIEWSGDVTFRKQTASATSGNQVLRPTIDGQFTKPNVQFKMYLFNGFDEQETGRHVTIKNIELVGKKSHYDIGTLEETEAGKVYPITDIYDPKSEVAGRLDTQYNNLLGKWESGTPQMMAVLTTDIPAATGVDIETLEEEDVEFLLNKDTGQEIVFGSAIPLHMQDVNPRRWSPNYDKYENSREFDDYEKSHIRVANIMPTFFSRGEMVILNRIEGLWFPISVTNVSGLLPEPERTVFPQWEFMYLATNARHHFRLSNNLLVKPDEFEKGFYLKYYENDDIETNKNRYNRGSYEDKIDVRNEYYQFTSWDFMGDAIGGLRSNKEIDQIALHRGNLFNNSNLFLDFSEEPFLCTDFDRSSSPPYEKSVNGNALSNTNFYEDVEGEDYDDEIRNTYPFFGCIFPDGFSTGRLFDKINGDVAVLGKTNEGKMFSVIPPSYAGLNKITFLPTRGNVLKNHNDVSAIAGDTHQTLGMFFDSGNLSHLPADIATISSPLGTWGYPISHVSIFDVSSNKDEGMKDRLHDYVFSSGRKFGEQQRYGWIYNKEIEHAGSISGSNIHDNSWGLKPINPLRVQFRPLSKELYSFLEQTKGEFNGDSFDFTPWFGNDYPDFWPDAWVRNGIMSRGNESKRLFSGTNFKSPVSKYAVSRELKHLLPPPNNLITSQQREASKSLIGPFGLKYCIDLGSGVLPNILDGTDEGYPYNWWNQQWVREGLGPGAAGGVGIIGAAATVFANGTISFSTENVHLEDFSTLGVAAESLHSVKTGDYDDDSTTTLFARVYKHWPRKLTMFDPRFLVVHHFNPGVENPHKSDPDANFASLNWNISTKASGIILDNVPFNITDGEVISRLIVEGKLPEGATVSDLPRSYAEPSGFFLTAKETFSTDMRVPTSWNRGKVAANTNIYNDSTTNGNLPEGEKIRRPSEWIINNTRRGKLLPYTYRSRSIGVGREGNDYRCVLMEDPNIYGGSKVDSNEVPFNEVEIQSTDVVIIASGEGYKLDEEFTIDGGNGAGAVFKVTEVTSEGGIKNIAPRDDLDRGIGYSPSDFKDKLRLNGGDPTATPPVSPFWEPNTLIWKSGEGPPSAKLAFTGFTEGSKSPTGEGFIAYAIRGTVLFSPELTDAKPAEPLDSSGPIELTAKQYPLSQNTVNSYNIVDPDDEDTYDVFLRYHNDISHVGIGADGSIILPNPREQMVTLTIGTRIGDAGVGDSVDFDAPGGGLGFSSNAGAGDSFFFGGFAGGGLGGGGFFF